MATVLLRATALDAKSLGVMRNDLNRSANHGTPDTSELVAAYRRAVSDLSQAADSPAVARRARGVRGALELVHDHYGEAISSACGTSRRICPEVFPGSVSQERRKDLREVFTDLRLERAKQLLTGTDLSATRVAELCGFRTPQYLCHVFRRAVGATPIEYRLGKLPHWAKPRRKRK